MKTSTCGKAGKGLDRRGARVAGGRANDGRPFAPRFENMIDELLARSCIARSLKASVGP